MFSGLNSGVRFNCGRLGPIQFSAHQSSQYCLLNNEQNAFIEDDYHRLLGPLLQICPQLQTLGSNNDQLNNRMLWNRCVEENFFKKFKSENSACELKRQMKIHELLQLELNLCMDIAVLISVYQRPMLHLRLITGEESVQIFANLETLFIIHQKLAIGLAAIRNPDGVYQSGPGSVVLKWANHHLHHYLSYCPNLPTARKCITQKQLPSNNSPFDAYLRSESVVRFSRRFDLWTMIDRPRRHLMNYSLVLASISRLTIDPEDVANLQRSIDKTKSIITQIQQRMDQQNLESLVVRFDLKQSKNVDNSNSSSAKQRHLIASQLNSSSRLIMESSLQARKIRTNLSTANATRRPRIRFHHHLHHHHHHYHPLQQKLSLILFDRLLVLAKPAKNDRFLIVASVDTNHQLHYYWHREASKKPQVVVKKTRRSSTASYRRTRWRNLINLMVYVGGRIRKRKMFPQISAVGASASATSVSTKSKRKNHNCLCLRAPNTKFNIDCRLRSADEVKLWVSKLQTVFTMVDESCTTK